MLIGDIVAIDFETFPFHNYSCNKILQDILDKNYPNIWIIFQIYIGGHNKNNVWVKHNNFNRPEDPVLLLSMEYIITMDFLRNKKIDKILE